MKNLLLFIAVVILMTVASCSPKIYNTGICSTYAASTPYVDRKNIPLPPKTYKSSVKNDKNLFKRIFSKNK